MHGWLALVVAFAMSGIASTVGLKCWNCNTAEGLLTSQPKLTDQDWCGDSNNLDAHKDEPGVIQNCEAKKCMKFHGDSKIGAVVGRGCATKINKVGCLENSENGVTTKTCVCDTELCNSATRKSNMFLGTVTVFSVLKFVYKVYN